MIIDDAPADFVMIEELLYHLGATNFLFWHFNWKKFVCNSNFLDSQNIVLSYSIINSVGELILTTELILMAQLILIRITQLILILAWFGQKIDANTNGHAKLCPWILRESFLSQAETKPQISS